MRQKLVEKFNRDWKETKLKPVFFPLTESTKLVEGINGDKYNCLSCYLIPIWKLDEENLNGRKYSRSLAEKIVKENKVTVSLDSHPEDDNYVPVIADVIAIGKDPVIKDGILWAYAYFVSEEVDKKVHRMLDLGFPLQQSSSGLGEVDYNNVVITETYDLERYFDFLVQDSSYQVYTTKENEIITDKPQKMESTDIKESIKESIEEKIIEPVLEKLEESKKEYLKENVTISNIGKSINIKEKTMAENKSLRLNVKSLIREAKAKEDLSEKNILLKEAFGAIKNESGFEDMKKDIVLLLKETDLSISNLAKKGKTVDSVTSKYNESAKEAVALKAEREIFVGKIQESANKLKQVSATAKDLAKKFKEASTKFKENSDKNKDAFNKLKESAIANAKLIESNAKLVEKSIIALDLIKERYNTLEFRNEALARKVEQLINENNKKDREIRRMSRQNEAQEPRSRSVRESVNEDSYNTEMPDEYKQTEEVTRYYEDTVRRKPYLARFKEKILNSKTVQDAMYRVLQIDGDDFDEKAGKHNSINESIEKIDDGREVKQSMGSSLLGKRPGWN